MANSDHPLDKPVCLLPDRLLADRYTFAGNYLSKLGSSSAWSVQEFRAQVALSRAQRAQNSLGNIFFSFKILRADTLGIVSVFRDELYATPALPPPLASMRTVKVAPPQVTLAGKTVAVTHAAPAGLRGWLVYAQGAADAGAGWTLHSVVPATKGSIALEPGRWVISALGKHDVESRGVLVEVK